MISLGVLLALCVLGDAIAMVSLDRTTRQLTSLAESHRIQSMRSTLASDAVQLQSELLAYVAGRGVDIEHRNRHADQFQESLNRCGACHHEPRIQTKLDAMHGTFDAYQVTVSHLDSASSPDEAETIQDELIDVVDSLVTQTNGISDMALYHLTNRSDDAARKMRHARDVLGLTVVAALIFGGLVALHLQRRLTRPVAALLDGIARVRQGDLSHHFEIEADEEFHALGAAFNQAYKGLKDAQENMLQTEKMAAVGKLAAGVAHEVNNPLASISSVAQIMRRRCDSAEQKEQIDLIMAEIARISRIVREVQTFSRPARPEERGEVRIDIVLDHAIQLLSYDNRARDIAVTCEHGAGLGTVLGDSDRLLLVFTNIILNAFDAIGQEAGSRGALRISTRREPDTVVVRFADNGPGMDEQQVAKAFEPFYTTKGPGEGTGLGLWICYQVVQGHHGTIRFESRRGEGTTVIVSLPCPADGPPRSEPDGKGAHRALAGRLGGVPTSSGA